jgi:hypothetical protein
VARCARPTRGAICAATTTTSSTSRCWARAASCIAGDAELPVPDGPPQPDGERGALPRRRRDGRRAVRVAYLWLPASAWTPRAPLVQVAETLDKRSQLATEIIKGVILPQFVILPLAVLLVWFALARGIRPLADLQQRIRRRESTDLSPLDERDVPEEVAPLVGAINDLLGRLDRSLRTQKHFLADAAHQLKTPLAGLRMQAELAAARDRQRPAATRGAEAALAAADRSVVQRAAHMVNQLLAMARAEDPGRLRRVQVDLAALATETVRDFVPRAMDQAHRPRLRGPGRGRRRGAAAAGRAGAAARAGAQPGGQRAAVHARGGTVTGPRAARPLRPGGGAAGRGHRPRHSRGRARAGVPALLPRAGHRGRRQRPGPGHRAGDRRSATTRRGGDRAHASARAFARARVFTCGFRCSRHDARAAAGQRRGLPG